MAGPELTLAWWDKNKAKTLPPTNLGKALQAYEKAVKTYAGTVARPGSKDLDAHFKALNTATTEVKNMLKATLGKCNKQLHKETMAHLTKMSDMVTNDGDKYRKAYGQAKIVAAQKVMSVRESALKQIEMKNLVKRIGALDTEFSSLDKSWKDAADILKKDAPTEAEVKQVYGYIKLHKDFTQSYRTLLEDADTVAKLPFPEVDIVGLETKAAGAVKMQEGRRATALTDAKRGAKALAGRVGDLRFFRERVASASITNWQKAHPGRA